MKNSNVYVVCNSHRAYDKLLLVLDKKPIDYYNFYKAYQLTEIPVKHLKEALEITGVRIGKFEGNWRKCWVSETIRGEQS